MVQTSEGRSVFSRFPIIVAYPCPSVSFDYQRQGPDKPSARLDLGLGARSPSNPTLSLQTSSWVCCSTWWYIGWPMETDGAWCASVPPVFNVLSRKKGTCNRRTSTQRDDVEYQSQFRQYGFDKEYRFSFNLGFKEYRFSFNLGFMRKR